MNKVILHIGRHKSGTSSLQKFLYTNRLQLEEYGFYYPLNGLKGIAHHHISLPLSKSNLKTNNLENILKTKVFLDFYSEVKTKLNKFNVIVSSEAFQNCDPKSIKYLFKDLDVKVVVYVREQVSYLISSYSQYIQNNNSNLTIDEYEKMIFNADYLKFLKNWQNIFSNLSLSLFSREKLKNCNIIDDFLINVLKLPENTMNVFNISETDQNPSIGWKLVELKRLINSDLFRISDRKTLYDSFKKLSNLKLNDETIKISENLFKILHYKYSKSNHALNKSLLIDQNLILSKLHILDKSQELSLNDSNTILQALFELIPNKDNSHELIKKKLKLLLN